MHRQNFKIKEDFVHQKNNKKKEKKKKKKKEKKKKKRKNVSKIEVFSGSDEK